MSRLVRGDGASSAPEMLRTEPTCEYFANADRVLPMPRSKGESPVLL
jgi:hypothetical protein